MIRNGLGTLLVASILLSACGGDDPRSPGDDSDGAVRADGSVGDGGSTIDIRDSSIDAALPDGGALDAAVVDGAQRLPDGALVYPIPLGDGGPFVLNDAGQVLCGTVACQCADGKDQDSDGLVDLADPECVAPWDNDEATFATGISGDNRDTACQDCFFDGNSGSGNDGCRIATSCLRNANDDSSGRGSCDTCTATPKCRTSCQAYTPNGCDCFGCCTVNLGSNITKSVALSGTCDINGTTLSAACIECVPSTSCRNECGRCELCPGKTLADLPSDCTSTPPPPDGGVTLPDGGVVGEDGGFVGATDSGVPGTPTPTCDLGEASCGAGLPACGSGMVCAFGCCILTPLL